MDKHEEVFGNAVDFTDKAGQKIGYWIIKGGWKIIIVIVTTLAIIIFGSTEFVRGIGRGVKKAHTPKT